MKSRKKGDLEVKSKAEIDSKSAAAKIVTGSHFKELALQIMCGSAYAIRGGSTVTNEVIMAQAMDELAPKDALESMLCSQIVALQFVGIHYLGRSKDQPIRCHQDDDVNLAIKLMRLSNESIERLEKLRRKGEQKVVVQHVNVNQGGQAVVGNVCAPGGG